MSRLTELIAQAKARDPQLGADLEREFKALSSRLAFGLNFERHRPEAVELPHRTVRKGDKVRVLSARGSTKKGDQRLWAVKKIEKGEDGRLVARLELIGSAEPESQDVSVDDLVVVAEFRDHIYPGIVSTGKVERGGDKPYHTVINGENYHVLKALTYTHRGKIDAIYIDPPYNTGAKDWKYNNDYVEGDDLYRHSKWLAMMERRLMVAQELLNPADSVLIVTIDEKEVHRLGLLLEQIFPEARIQMVSIVINGAVVSRASSFGRSDEYVYFVFFGNAAPVPIPLGPDWSNVKGVTHQGQIRWDRLIRSGTGAGRTDSPGCYYPVYVSPNGPTIIEIGDPITTGQPDPQATPERIPILPKRKNSTDGRWQMTPMELRQRLSQGRVRVGGNVTRGFTLYYLKDGEYKKVVDGLYPVTGRRSDGSLITENIDAFETTSIPSTQWRVPAHDASHYGSRLLLKLLPDRKFPFPKALYAVEDVLRFFIINKQEAVVLDFFAGSGTTAHAVMRLNHQDDGRRQCISVTNNEVAADEQTALRKQGLRPGDAEWEQWGICDYITKPRIEAAITGNTPSGEPIMGDYKFTDEFPMAEGFEENAEFFTLTYETPVAISHNLAFARIAPLLWMRAGSEGRRIDTLPDQGWAVVDTYGLLTDLDNATAFCQAVEEVDGLRIAYIVTNDDRRFQSVARHLPDSVEPVRLYESYLANFQFANGE